MKTWNDKLLEWSSGKYLQYPRSITKSFFYETSICTNKLDTPYQEIFIPDSRLLLLEQDNTSFNKQIQSAIQKGNKYAISFTTLGGDAILIIPIPRKKNFTTIKDFIDNASIKHQREFWKYASKIIQQHLKTQKAIYVSTHGLGVSYFHLRLDTTPKYYQSNITNNGLLQEL
jgi:hypothetical protein